MVVSNEDFADSGVLASADVATNAIEAKDNVNANNFFMNFTPIYKLI